jgi:hypothetical protein
MFCGRIWTSLGARLRPRPSFYDMQLGTGEGAVPGVAGRPGEAGGMGETS